MSNSAEQMLKSAVAFHKAGDIDQAEPRYDALLNQDHVNPMLLYLQADIMCRRKRYGMAMTLLERCLGIDPTNRDAWINLGCCYKAEQDPKRAEHCWTKAMELGESADVYSNFSTLYADTGEPEKALAFVAKAEALEPGNPNTRWSKALALLTRREWPAAWEAHEARRELATYKPRSFAGAPEWTGETLKGTLVISGEQGLGDEIMFASCIPDAVKLCERVVVECTPRLVPIISRSFGVAAYESEEAVMWAEKPDAHLPLGSLAKHFRTKDEDFPKTPYLKADHDKVERYRERLSKLGPRPWVGISWQGGSRATRIHERSIGLDHWGDMLNHTVVSLQYAEMVEEAAVKHGVPHWPEAVGNTDYEETIALVSALDCVVTVATAIVHLSGSLGKPCFVMTPRNSSWRYGMGDRMIWYGSVELIRQDRAGEWEPVLERTSARLKRFAEDFWQQRAA